MSHDDYTIQPIPTAHCYQAWQHVRGHLGPAIIRSGGRWRPEYVFAALINGAQTLWTVTREGIIVGAFTTEFCQYPERRMLAVHFLGGNEFPEWYDTLFREVTAFARAHECHAIECNARAGFWRWFKQDGFERKSVFYEKDLRGEGNERRDYCQEI